MKYYVITYPELSSGSFEWIQKYRESHDSQYKLVDPHFTLVFGIEDIDEHALVKEIEKYASDTDTFTFKINSATINVDKDRATEFLVPDEGNSALIKLHDKLYSGILADHLRLDMNYVPHITIGDRSDIPTSKAHITKLNSSPINIEGEITSIDIIKVENTSQLMTIKKVPLRERGSVTTEQ